MNGRNVKDRHRPTSEEFIFYLNELVRLGIVKTDGNGHYRLIVSLDEAERILNEREWVRFNP